MNLSVQQAIESAIHYHGEIGLQVAAYVADDIVVDAWSGLADETTGGTVDGDTVFPVFSVIKAVTATALHIQADRGLIDYNAPVALYWPEFGAHGKDKGTVLHALTHRIGTPQMPQGVTPEKMCDWKWMVHEIADMKPLFEPGTRSAYLSYTFGWIIGEIVRRTDPKRRSFGNFVQDEICSPLGIDSLWIGITDEVEPRVAKLTNMPPPGLYDPARPLMRKTIPPQVGTTQEVFGRHDVRRACIPGAGGFMNARSGARFFAMLANGGELNGVRLLSEERIQLLRTPRPNREEFDPVAKREMRHLGMGGIYVGDGVAGGNTVIGRNPHTLWHVGAGGSIAWADPDTNLAVAICHNRMFSVRATKDNPFLPIAIAIREALGLSA